MKHRDKNIVAVEELLLRECRGMSSSRTIEHLFECGLLSEARCKAFLARKMVAQRQAEGMTKMDSMESVAVAMNCSPATISNYIYYNAK